MNLILDIQILIASYDEEVWIKLYLYDERFAGYARGNAAINLFTKLFTKRIINTKYGIIETYLFGKLNSINDEPSKIIMTDKTWFRKEWNRNGYYHRDYDMPAIIYVWGELCWYTNGRPQINSTGYRRLSYSNMDEWNKDEKKYTSSYFNKM